MNIADPNLTLVDALEAMINKSGDPEIIAWLRAASDRIVKLENAAACRGPVPTYVNRCAHEWWQGKCIHCDVAAKDGKPVQDETTNG